MEDKKYTFGVSELGEYTTGILVLDNKGVSFDIMNAVEVLDKIFELLSINHYKVMSPGYKAEYILMHKTDLIKLHDFHKEAMENIPEHITPTQIEINKSVADALQTMADLLKDDMIDFYGIIVTTDDDFDIQDYIPSIDSTPILEFANGLTAYYEEGN